MRRFLVILLLVVVALSGAWTVAWYVAARQLIDGVDRWAAARRAEGWQVTYGVPTATGFPTKIEAQIPDPAIVAPAPRAGGLGWEWHGLWVHVEIVPWRPNRVVLRNRGENRLVLIRDATRFDAVLDCTDAMVRLAPAGRSDGPETRQYVVELADPKFRLAVPPVSVQASELSVTLELHRVPPGDHLALAADLGFAVDDLVTNAFGKAGEAPLSANLHAELMGALPPGPLDQAVTAWRDDGGTIEIPRLVLGSSGITMLTNGTLALDNQMRPMGAATAAIRGYDAAIDRMTALGSVNPRDAQLAKLLLSAMATADDDGERVLRVPITSQNGWLYVGPMRLTRLEPLRLR
jgi:hypothetical protein